jgi:hypothetical protein
MPKISKLKPKLHESAWFAPIRRFALSPFQLQIRPGTSETYRWSVVRCRKLSGPTRNPQPATRLTNRTNQTNQTDLAPIRRFARSPFRRFALKPPPYPVPSN